MFRYDLSSLQLVEVLSEVSSLEEILFVGHTGVVVKLAEAAISSPCTQPGLLADILTAFHTDSHPNSSAPVLLALLTYDVFCSNEKEEKEEEGGAEESAKPHPKPHPTTLHGSLLLQALLQFEDARVVSRSLLKLRAEELLRLSCDSHGSHVITTFLTSNTIPAKRKEKLISKLEVGLEGWKEG